MNNESSTNSLIYVRCRFCGQVFKGHSDDTLENWSNHIASCEKRQTDKEKSQGNKTL